LFKSALALIKYYENSLMKSDSLESFKNTIKSLFENFSDFSFLLFCIVLKKFEFNSEILNKNRNILEPEVLDNLKKINKNKIIKLEERVKNLRDNCVEDWPICVYDYESVYKVYDFCVYRQAEEVEILEDYFGHCKFSSELVFKSLNKNSSTSKSLNTYYSVLIQRKHHVCRKEKRKKTDKSSGLCTVLDQLNELDDSLLNMSTGTGDKSNEISRDNKSTESFDDKSSLKEEMKSNYSEKKMSPKKLKLNDSVHEMTKQSYKKFSIFL
jgi:hypothetical protein